MNSGVKSHSFISTLNVDGKPLEERLKSMDSSDKRLRNIKKGLRVLMGGGKTIVDDLVEVTDEVFKRDFQPFYDLGESDEKVQAFVPDYFLTKSFNNLSPGKEDERVHQIEEYIKKNPDEEYKFVKILEKIKTETQVIKGDRPEMHLFDALKDYCSSRNEICLVFHGQNLYDIDITMHREKAPKMSEKDFIILNLTYRYVMIIEVKNTYGGKNVAKAEKQLTGARESFQAWFGADLDQSWSIILIVYCTKAIDNMTPSNAYLIEGKYNKAENLQKIFKYFTVDNTTMNPKYSIHM